MSDSFIKEFLEDLKKKRPTYKDLIDFCSDGMILNNYILPELESKDFIFDVYCGSLDDYDEIFQYYIISSSDANRFAEFTNEFVLYNENLDLYILCVTHFGTPWSGVSANWREI